MKKTSKEYRFVAVPYRFNELGEVELLDMEFFKYNMSTVRQHARTQLPWLGYFYCFKREDGKFYTGADSGVELTSLYDKIRTT